VIAFAVQFGEGDKHPPADLLYPVLTLVAAAIIGGLLVKLAERVVPAARRAIRSQKRLRAAAAVELRARAMMDELCPEGWQAQILMFSSANELPDDAPDPSRTRILIEWEQLGQPSLTRQIWARDIKQALESMVAERITDDTLQQIEQRALLEGTIWPDIDPI
jgi:hypothetical protein